MLLRTLFRWLAKNVVVSFFSFFLLERFLKWIIFSAKLIDCCHNLVKNSTRVKLISYLGYM
jgi:hypothetical protein